MPRYFLTPTGPNSGERFELPGGPHQVGRVAEVQLRIDDHTISRRHAEILVRDDEVLIRDLDSLNGTFINGKQLRGKGKLQVGDEVRFGSRSFRLTESDTTPVANFGDFNTPATLTTTMQDIRQQASTGRADRLLIALAEAGQMLSRQLALAELLEAMLDLLDRFLPASRILILGEEIVDGRPEVLAHRINEGTPEDQLRMSQHMLREILEKGESLLTQDAATDDRWDSKHSIVQMGVHAAMGAPLFDNDRILGAIYVDSRKTGLIFGEEDLRLLTLLANMIAVKMTNSRLEEEEQRLAHLRRELTLAARIQRKLLPLDLPVVAGYELFAHLEACEDVGGDLYDVRDLGDGNLWLALGDVTGHGIGASLFMSYVMAGLQFLEYQNHDPVTLISLLEQNLEDKVEIGQYVTMFAGLLNTKTGRLVYVNAGHPPPLILRDGEMLPLITTGVPVAILPGGHTRSMAETRIEKGDTLLVFSDGITESEHDNVQYDEGRMQAFLSRPPESPTDLVRGLLEDVGEFRQNLSPEDDLTLLAVRRP
jgi:serine phosphatase RsbU (regulator of sigma subunit)/pSer/pThr/pTyr-binding forkhead associated (FHA) protein